MDLVKITLERYLTGADQRKGGDLIGSTNFPGIYSTGDEKNSDEA